MKTIEQAIVDIEDSVSRCYHHSFENSKLRTATEDNIEFLKFNFGSMLNSKKEDVKKAAFERIIDIVVDDSVMGTGMTYKEKARTESRILDKGNQKDYLKACIDDCDVIINRLAENESNDGEMSVKEIKDKYVGKYLIFNGDEDGMQIVYVEDINYRGDGFYIDGYMIDLCNTNHENGEGILMYDIVDWGIGDFWYADDDIETTNDLDEFLQSSPIDLDKKEFPSHVITKEKAAEVIKEQIRWILNDRLDEDAPII